MNTDIKREETKLVNDNTGDPVFASGLSDNYLTFGTLTDFLVTYVFYSPFILAIQITSLSFIFQNIKGLVYLGCLFFACCLRFAIYQWLPMINMDSDNKRERPAVCDATNFSIFSHNTFSVFTFAFTIFYLVLPMIINQTFNWVLLGYLIFFLFLDVGIRYRAKCIIFKTDVVKIMYEVIFGTAFAIAAVMGLRGTGKGSGFLFFNEINAGNAEVCNMPSKQTFRCNVYKNGEIIGSV